ncbi:MAG TPA: NHL repeat-containing protein, partial [Patescibacteria group bacterium]|nr:NHL repeat-containing protein [Patescibacteria group bacterium]
MKKFAVFVLLTSLLIFPGTVSAYTTNMDASLVIGQQNFTSGIANQGGSAGANTLSTTLGTLVVNGKLLISDFGNHRVLIYNSIPSANNSPADIVIGQANFSSNSFNQGGSAGPNTLRNPNFLATDGQKLAVVDDGNNRVLIFNSIPIVNNASADVVVGQSNFTGVSPGTNSSSFFAPRGIAIFGNKLLVADETNNRILIWNTIPSTNGVAADVILTKGSASSNLNQPYQISVDGNGRLVEADRGNNRVLIWNSIPTVSDTLADVVVGQPDFSTTSTTPISSTKTNGPRGVIIDHDRLFIADRNNNRILVYNSVPVSNGASADIVIGQPNFAVGSANGGGSISSNVMSGPFAVNVYNNQLFVSEISNNRLLIFNNIVRGPGLSLAGSPTRQYDNIFRQFGTAVSDPLYVIHSVEYSVNGGSFSSAVPTDGTFDSVREDFHLDFNPTLNQPRDIHGDLIDGYTLRLRSFNSNVDVTDHLF